MTFDAHADLVGSVIAAAPSPAVSGMALEVSVGDGAKFPSPPFNAPVFPLGMLPEVALSTAEIVRVTGIAGDTFTILRAQEGTSARTIVAGDRIIVGPTAKTFTDIESATSTNGTAIAAEVSRATTAEGTLTSGLAAEISRATIAEGAKASASALTAETSRAITAEGANAAAIATEVTNRANAVALLAPLASPALTGSPTAPTQTGSDNSTKLATTAFVQGHTGGAQDTLPTAVLTGAQSLSPGQQIKLDISGGSAPSTLPSSPANGTRCGIKVVKVSGTPGSTNATLVCGGSDVFNISAGSTSLTFTALMQGATVEYRSADSTWTVQSTDTPLNVPLGAAKLGTDGTVGGPSGSALSPSVVVGSGPLGYPTNPVTNPAAARPSLVVVYWLCVTQPTNWLPGDVWRTS